MKLLRCLLFIPGTDLNKFLKTRELKPDGIILDLEDAVAEKEKEKARQTVQNMLTHPLPPTVFIRVNGVDTQHILADLLAFIRPDITGIMLAKTESLEQVRQVDWLISLLEKDRQMSVGQLELIPFIESVRGVENVNQIAAASPRVKRLALGGNDYTTDTWTNYTQGGAELFYPRTKLIIASRLANLEPPLDTVCPWIRDISALKEDALRGRQMGFQGKMVIHPAQIDPVLEVFSPTNEEINKAQKIVAAFETAEAAGTGVIQLDGQMVEYPIANRAKQILAIAKKCNINN